MTNQTVVMERPDTEAATAPAPPAAPVAACGGALTARVTRINDGLAAAGELVDPELAARASADLARVQGRLALGVDRTVVALVGGTGSGKSSLFNAITGLTFADVGAIRPTTERAAACVWGGEADELLDFLAVADQRRIVRESALDSQRERALNGLVLLDMPDHDSVAEEHALQVDRLLPLIDILVWVVDPQKYADHALHDRYLRALAGRQDAMLVLVNQVDTIPAEAVTSVADGVRALLAADGLDDVEVHTTSAVTGEGIAEVRCLLALAVARASVSARTAEAEIDAVAARLRAAVGGTEPPTGAPVAAATEELAAASGIGAVEASVRTAVARAGSSALAQPEPPAEPTVAAVRARWVERTATGLPPRWRAAIDEACAPAGRLAGAAARAVADVALPSVHVPRAAVMRGLGLTVAGLGALVLAVLAVLGVGAAVGWDVPTAALPIGAVSTTALLGGGLAALVLGVVLLLGARSARRSAADRVATAYRADVTERIRAVVAAELARPTEAVHARHREVREALR